MSYRYIWLNDERYYLYGTYDTKEEAGKIARHKKKKNGCKYYILEVESEGFLEIAPESKFKLYLNKSLRLF